MVLGGQSRYWTGALLIAHCLLVQHEFRAAELIRWITHIILVIGREVCQRKGNPGMSYWRTCLSVVLSMGTIPKMSVIESVIASVHP